MVSDLTYAIEYISKEVGQFGGDGDHIVPLGLSAGGVNRLRCGCVESRFC